MADNNTNTQEILDKFNNMYQLLSQNQQKILYIHQQKLELDKKVTQLSSLQNLVKTEQQELTTSHTLLTDFYNQRKVSKMNNMQEAITKLVNNIFQDKHNLQFKPTYARGKPGVELVTTDQYGKSLGSLSVLLSDAQQQMVGYYIQKITLNELNSNMLILDEAFNSFGDEEIKILAELLAYDDNFQHILIEHKEELFDKLNELASSTPINIVSYKMENNTQQGVHIANPPSNQPEILQEWSNILNLPPDQIPH